MKTEKRAVFTIRPQDGAFGCRLSADKAFRCETARPCPYDKETLAYAVCRYIRHCPQLRDPLIREAVHLALDPRGGKKRRRRRVHTRAAALELPGSEAWIRLAVKQGEILVTSLELFDGRSTYMKRHA